MKERMFFVFASILLVLCSCAGKTDYREMSGGENTRSSKESHDFQSSNLSDEIITSTNLLGSGTTAGEKTNNITSVIDQMTAHEMTGNTIDVEELLGTTTTDRCTGKTTTTTQQTTLNPVKPTQIRGILLPQTGYDLDGKGRLQVGEVSLSGQKLSLQLKNITKGWMTEETSYLEYTCYDKSGKELKKELWFFWCS